MLIKRANVFVSDSESRNASPALEWGTSKLTYSIQLHTVSYMHAKIVYIVLSLSKVRLKKQH